MPDPQDPETFRRSRLDWDELSQGRHAVVLDCYRRLGRLRRELPQLTDPAFGSVSCSVEGRLFTMRRDDLLVVVNAGEVDATVEVDEDCEVVFQSPSGVVLDGGVLTIPAHVGALVAPPRNFS